MLLAIRNITRKPVQKQAGLRILFVTNEALQQHVAKMLY